ncbi:MAG: N-6 DNA methylase [Deltaproteobacteria bacterium]|nr:N-6 DNA methylase [Deltaproteobacteria bacterium]MCB9789290.1 N-6 DNA methylase [Deltaproteobacteria bacterium]
MVQPVEGLVLSAPPLVEAQCAMHQSPHTQHELLARLGEADADGERRLTDLRGFLSGFLGWDDSVLLGPEAIPDGLELYVPEGHQLIRPTFALRDPFFDASAERHKDRGPTPDTPASEAGADLLLLVWQLPSALPFDSPETTTGEWHYPPARKFERLLRHCRVPLGLLSNGEALRLFYAPHGESLGSITFRLSDMAQTGGRPILDAFLMLLTADSLFSDPDRALLALCRKSRARQADVTEELARQVFEALTILLEGFEAAAARGTEADRRILEEALHAEESHLYGGLLAVLLRLVFTLYAEDNGILPVGQPVYAEHLSVLGLFAQLRDDAGAWPESMDRRFGAWPRLLALFRAIHGGLSHGDLQLPPRRGRLFDPDAYPFLEGRPLAGAAQVDARANAAVQTPRVDDGTVHQILERLLILEGQRLSYRALDVEQIGSVYERLMGYRVERLAGPAVYVKAGKTGAWLSTEAVAEVKPSERQKWLQSEWGMDKGPATALAKALSGASDDEAILDALETWRHPHNPSGDARKAHGRLVLQPGKERIRTSSHYTPRTLSQPIVQRTLEPVIAALGEAPTAEQLLSLKVCDPAMGSGAFLVETCRFLGDQVVSAWARQGELESIGQQTGDPTVHARRVVAQRCLYGVDKNRFAVDLARMSLWLVTLARDEPFTFVDHALRHGDTLVGLDVAAIRRFDWEDNRARQMDFFYQGLDGAILDALDKRQRILELAAEEGAGMAQQKESLLEEAEAAMELPRLVGDVLVGAWFGAAKDKDKDALRRERLAVIAPWLAGDEPAVRVPPMARQWAAEIRAHTPVFHWPLEFPEIFHARRADPLDGGALNSVAMMDAFVGNPPFAGKNAISEASGDDYIKWLQVLHPGSHGNADLSAHFFRRAAALLGPHGSLGLIATNTIAQGDTRTTGLQYLVVEGGFRIYEARQDLPWPGVAAVTIDVVHAAAGRPAAHVGQLMLDGAAVPRINSRLLPALERPDPVALSANAGKSYQGSIILGMGFTLTPDERSELVAADPRNAERIFPYMGGQELNSAPRQEHSRYVISFGDLSLAEAERWPLLIDRVRRLVKPERDQNKREVRRKYWWRFGETAPALYAALRPLDRCLACSRHSKHLAFGWQPTDRIFSEALNILPLDRDSHFALLQSRVHERWARLLSSSLGGTLRYTASDCFETFPFPSESTLVAGSSLDRAGKALSDARADYCINRNQGLTDTYNDLKDSSVTDPAVVHLRELHLAVDRAVIEAYGWQDVPVPRNPGATGEAALETMRLIEAIPPFTDPVTDEDKRLHQRFEDAVIDQLFALNAVRAAEEARQAPKAKGAARKAPAKNTKQGALDL